MAMKLEIARKVNALGVRSAPAHWVISYTHMPSIDLLYRIRSAVVGSAQLEKR